MRLPLLITGAALAAWIGGGTWYWMCPVKGHCAQPAETRTPEETPPPAQPAFPHFEVLKDGEALFSDPGNFRFERNSAIGKAPQSVLAQIRLLADYLKTHPDTDIEITGWYAADEGPAPGYENLGLARAAFFSDALASLGVNEKQMVRSYARKPVAALTFSDDSLVGPLAVQLIVHVATQAAPPPMALSFDTGSDDLVLNDELRAYITKTVQYLRDHPEARLAITGHTDNQGSKAANLELGLKRANKAANYFKDFGVEPGMMRSSSKGMEAPVAPNDTDANRARNRRVEISIVHP